MAENEGKTATSSKDTDQSVPQPGMAMTWDDLEAKLKEFGHDLSEYTDSPEVYAEIQEHVDRLNGQFSNPEQLKKFTILPRDLSVDHGELTPTLKIRRIQIRENWADEIEAMYADA